MAIGGVKRHCTRGACPPPDVRDRAYGTSGALDARWIRYRPFPRLRSITAALRMPDTDHRPLPARVAPPGAPLGSWGLLRAVLRNPLEAVPAAAYEEPLARQTLFGRERVFVSDPDLVERVLVAEADAFAKGEVIRRALGPALGDAILTADGERWRWQRRAAAPIFRHERVLGFLPAMLAAAERRRDQWLALPPGASVELGGEMMRTTFDVIVGTMLSGHGDGAAGLDVDRVEREITEYLGSTGWAILLALLKAPHWTPHPGRARAARARDYLRGELLRLVAERRRGDGARGGASAQREDLVDLLLRATDPETGRSMGDRDVADNLLTFITAGHETTALALTWAFYLLALHPEAEAAVVEEVERVTGGAALRPEHVGALAYTRQVLQEAMRLYPPAPLIARAAARDLELGGVAVARSTPVYVPVYAVHRHRALWPDPDRFDPERFRPEAARARHRYAFLPFGAGPRVCIGMSFAMAEAAAILATLLRAVRPALPAGPEPGLRLRVTLRPAAGMPMRPRRRAA
jgi:cytochrome P450